MRSARIRVARVHGTTPSGPRQNEVAGVARVMVVENQSVFGAGVQRLLAGAAGLEVIEIAPGDCGELIQEIKRVQPHVIVLNEAVYLADPVKLLSLLKDYPELRLMVVSPHDNLVRVYDKRQLLVTQAADLISMIRGERC